MRTATRRSRLSRLGLRRGLGLILPVAAAAWLAAPTLCRATPINYVFSSNASATFPDGTEAISGSFTADTTTGVLSNVSITLTSALPTSEEGTYTFHANLGFGNKLIPAINNSNNNLLSLEFSSPLDVSPDSLTRLSFEAGASPTVFATAVSGSAVFGPSAVPEPSALALLGTALAGLFLFRFGARRRGHRIDPRQPGTA